MTYWESILFGLIQGLTEFLPISSSGHLVLSEHLMNAKMPGVSFELFLHIGTLLSVLIYFHKKIILLTKSLFDRTMIEERKMVLFLVVGTLPAVLFALTLKDFIELSFGSPQVVSIFLMITGLILLLTGLPVKRKRGLSWAGALIIGIGQALAILPGISRSGTSISAGIFFGIKPIVAAEFSFLLSIPAILGAFVFKFDEIGAVQSNLYGPYILGSIISFLSGLFAVYILLKLIKKGKFVYFGIYCVLLGLVGTIYFR